MGGQILFNILFWTLRMTFFAQLAWVRYFPDFNSMQLCRTLLIVNLFGKLCLILFPAFFWSWDSRYEIMRKFHIFTTMEVLSRTHWPPNVPGYLLLHCRLCNLNRRYRHLRHPAHLWSSILIVLIIIVIGGLWSAYYCFTVHQCALQCFKTFSMLCRVSTLSFSIAPAFCL